MGTWIMTKRDGNYKPFIYGSPAAFVRDGDVRPSAFLFTEEVARDPFDGKIGICFMATDAHWSEDHDKFFGAEFMTVYASPLAVAETTEKLVALAR